MTQYRRKIANLNAFQWPADQPEQIPLWLASMVELTLPGNILLLKTRQRVTPTDWIVMEPGVACQIVPDGDFRDRYEPIEE